MVTVDGGYTIEGLAPGTWNVEVGLVVSGERKWTKVFEVEAGVETNIDLRK